MADWTTDAVDALEQAVDTVRDKTVVPAQRATRAVVYGLLVGFFVFARWSCSRIALFRVLVVITGDVWVAWLILGGIFVVAGAFCWTLRIQHVPRTRMPEARDVVIIGSGPGRPHRGDLHGPRQPRTRS